MFHRIRLANSVLEDMRREEATPALDVHQMPTAASRLNARMGVFAKLRDIRAFERKRLRFLRTMEDFDVLCEIGVHQEKGRPLTMKELHGLHLGSVPTMQRRLRRLRQYGAVSSRRTERDGRAVEVRITRRALKLFHRYASLLGRRG
jgi:DNA-binding MarR family transcriptional regulator